MWRANQIFLLINLLQLIGHISKTIGQFDKYLDQSTTSLPFVSRRVERGEHLFVFIITRARDDERRRRRFYRCRRIFCFPPPPNERTLSRLPQQLNPRNLSHDDGPKISCTRGETKQHVLGRGHMPLLGEHIALNMTMTP